MVSPRRPGATPPTAPAPTRRPAARPRWARGPAPRALGAETLDPMFAPESITPLYQRSLYQSMRNVQQRTLHDLATNLASLPAEVQIEAQQVLTLGEAMLQRFRGLAGRRLG